jgi:plastocyanin
MRSARLATLTFAALLVAAACSPAASSAPSAATGTAVSIVTFTFQPATLTVAVGTTITWTNNDTVAHIVTADDGSFESKKIAPGGTFSHAFATAGAIAYHCAIHASMKATVTVQ